MQLRECRAKTGGNLRHDSADTVHKLTLITNLRVEWPKCFPKPEQQRSISFGMKKILDCDVLLAMGQLDVGIVMCRLHAMKA